MTWTELTKIFMMILKKYFSALRVQQRVSFSTKGILSALVQCCASICDVGQH